MKVQLTKKAEASIRASARKGARLLDSIDKMWVKSQYLSLGRLDQTRDCSCVWGQLEGTDAFRYNDAFQEAFRHDASTPGYAPNHDKNHKRYETSQYHVTPICNESYFDLTTAEQELQEATNNEEWRILQDEWKTQIRLRRRALGVR